MEPISEELQEVRRALAASEMTIKNLVMAKDELEKKVGIQPL